MERVSERKNKIFYIAFLALVMLISFGMNYDGQIERYNTSMLALNYSYGFISRGFLGTVYHILNWILPWNLISYTAVMTYTHIVTILFLALTLYFVWVVLSHAKPEHYKVLQLTLLFFVYMTSSTFYTENNFGRVDMYMIALDLMGLILLIKRKWEWLVVPICAVGVMMHQAYVFLYINVLLVFLLYRFVKGDTFQKKKYGVLFLLSLLIASVLFLYFNFFAHTSDMSSYEQVVEEAVIMGPDGRYHESLLQHEILGVDPTSDELEWHKRNLVELLCFLGFLLPWIVIVVKSFRKLMGSVSEKWMHRFYLLASVGALTAVPCYLLKVDFGRWTMAVFVYYILFMVSFLADRDEKVCACITDASRYYREKPWMPLCYLYLFFMLPFFDISINQVCARAATILNEKFLHFWVES